MKKLIQQDDCAPDSMDVFRTQFLNITKMKMSDFVYNAIRKDENDGMTMQWHYSDWVLEFSGDDPFYILYEIEPEGRKKIPVPYDKEQIKKFVKEFIWLAVLNIAGEDLPVEKIYQFEMNFSKEWDSRFGEEE